MMRLRSEQTKEFPVARAVPLPGASGANAICILVCEPLLLSMPPTSDFKAQGVGGNGSHVSPEERI